MNQCWLNGRVLNCISSPRKLGKADMESLNKICPSEKSHASQEWACLIVFAMPSHQLGAVQGGKYGISTRTVICFKAWQLGQSEI